MELNSDFSELLQAFNAAGVKYLVIGGYAMAVHGFPRFTKDLDLWIEASPENARRTYDALRNFGAPLDDLTEEDLRDPEIVFQIGVAPVRADILVSITDVAFDVAWPQRIETHYGSIPVCVIGKEALIRNKRATGRPRDILDAEELER
jgi:hypothetical protein